MPIRIEFSSNPHYGTGLFVVETIISDFVPLKKSYAKKIRRSSTGRCYLKNYLDYIRQSRERKFCELVGIGAVPVNPMALSKDDRHKKRMKL